jgi:hypothetical protein
LGLLSIAIASGITACATPSPDVVATQQSPARDASFDARLPKLLRVRPCRVGKYRGIFSSVPAGDAAQLSSLTGVISFELVEVQSGEFLKVSSGEQLQGSSEQGDTFTADIDADSSGCREGLFNVQLKNGSYVLAQSPQVSFGFIGSVDGKYLADDDNGYEGFLGKWIAYWPLDPAKPTPIANGQWSATLTAL